MRLLKRPSIGEAFGIGLAVSFVGIALWLQLTGAGGAKDFAVYMRTTQGDYLDFYYGYWIVPLFSLLGLLPSPLDYAVWMIINLAGLWFAARVFGGRPGLVLCSYPAFFMLYWGQISGLLLGSLALCWWALLHRKWVWAGLGLILACSKYQVGVPLSLILLFCAGVPWKQLPKIALIPTAAVLLSLIIYPLWPIQILERFAAHPPVSDWSITLWRLAGPASLLLWIPPLVLPMPRHQRMLALVATTCLAQPYFLMGDLMALFIFPVEAIALASWLGAYPYFRANAQFVILGIIPGAVYLRLLLPALASLLKRKLAPEPHLPG